MNQKFRAGRGCAGTIAQLFAQPKHERFTAVLQAQPRQQNRKTHCTPSMLHPLSCFASAHLDVRLRHVVVQVGDESAAQQGRAARAGGERARHTGGVAAGRRLAG